MASAAPTGYVPVLRRFALVVPVLALAIRPDALNAADENSEIVKRCKAATALVEVSSWGAGTAFCVHRDGLFVTNHHVVQLAGNGKLRLILNSGESNESIVDAQVVQSDEEHDLALLKTEGTEKFSPLRIRSSEKLAQTEAISVYGYPFGTMLSREEGGFPSISVNAGHVTALRRAGGKLKSIQFDAAVNPGNSGGPVLDAKGGVVGVVTSTYRGSGVSFAIPSDDLKAFLAKPAVAIRSAPIKYDDRNRPTTFEVSVISFEAASAPDELKIEYQPADEPNLVEKTLALSNNRASFTAAPFADPKSTEATKLKLIAYLPDRHVEIDQRDISVTLGKESIPLSQIRMIERRPDTWIITRTTGERWAGQLSGLPNITVDGKAIDLTTAPRIDVAALDAAPPQLPYTVRARRKGKQVATISGSWTMLGGPLRYKDEMHDPRDPTATNVEELEIEVVLDGMSRLYLTREGLQWEYLSLVKPGLPQGDQFMTMVNGKPWVYGFHQVMPRRAGRVREMSDILPLRIPQGRWNVELVSLRKHKETRPDPGRGTVAVGESKAGNMFLEFDDSGPGHGAFRLRLRRLPPSNDPMGGELQLLAGRWVVRYSNSARRLYDISPDLKISNLTDNTAGEIAQRDDHWRIDLHDGKLERLRFQSPFEILIHHFDPAANYPKKPGPTGWGQKVLVPLEK